MKLDEKSLYEYILSYCEAKNIQIDLRFRCFGDVNKFHTNNTELVLECHDYYTRDNEGIKKFFAYFLDTMWENCKPPFNRIALYIKDVVDRGGWYEVNIGSGLITDEALL